MKNAAGDYKCDEYIRKELEEAKIPYVELEVFRHGKEVPSALIGDLHGWVFRRAWRYWVARSERTVLLFQYAEPLHEKYGNEVRVDGHCCCPSPKEWLNQPWHIGVNCYHVDTQDGLNALVKAIKLQTEMNK
jgi:hypothetical protein